MTIRSRLEKLETKAKPNPFGEVAYIIVDGITIDEARQNWITEHGRPLPGRIVYYHIISAEDGAPVV